MPIRPLFPRLEWVDAGGEAASYDGGEPLLVVLWQPECGVCLDELKAIGESDLGVRCVALTGADVTDEILGSGFRHEVGQVSEAVVERILRLHRHLFYRPYRLKVPVAR